ncbi:MAG TPA: DUF167 domain-containing protein [Candidatus Dormibacteraeota bacterium]|nr:DUF167 domain-containing protein [Candidatus Dormibacteraeota bacterium]
MSARCTVRLSPRSGADRVEGVGPAGELLVRVRAAPVDQAANGALLRLLADELDLPASAIELVSGARARRKAIVVVGRSASDLVARWPGLAARDAG